MGGQQGDSQLLQGGAGQNGQKDVRGGHRQPHPQHEGGQHHQNDGPEQMTPGKLDDHPGEGNPHPGDPHDSDDDPGADEDGGGGHAVPRPYVKGVQDIPQSHTRLLAKPTHRDDGEHPNTGGIGGGKPPDQKQDQQHHGDEENRPFFEDLFEIGDFLLTHGLHSHFEGLDMYKVTHGEEVHHGRYRGHPDDLEIGDPGPLGHDEGPCPHDGGH